jgi:ABC-2 type transport system permease protein
LADDGNARLLVKIDNIAEIFSAFYEAGRYPITIYPGLVRALLTFLVLVAFVTTFPVKRW